MVWQLQQFIHLYTSTSFNGKTSRVRCHGYSLLFLNLCPVQVQAYLTIPYDNWNNRSHSTYYCHSYIFFSTLPITVPYLFQYYIHFSTIYISVLYSFQYYIHFSTLSISVPYLFQYHIYFSTTFISVLYPFQYYNHFSTISISAPSIHDWSNKYILITIYILYISVYIWLGSNTQSLIPLITWFLI